jgi:hypothetical protein
MYFSSTELFSLFLLDEEVVLYNENSVWVRQSLGIESIREPIQALIETITCGGAGGLDVPLPVAHRMQAKLVGDLRDGHGVRQILS